MDARIRIFNGDAYFKTLTHEHGMLWDKTGEQRPLSCPTSGKNDNEMTINLDFRLEEYQHWKFSANVSYFLLDIGYPDSSLFQSFRRKSPMHYFHSFKIYLLKKFWVPRLMFRSKPAPEWKFQIKMATVFSNVLITVFKFLKKKKKGVIWISICSTTRNTM